MKPRRHEEIIGADQKIRDYYEREPPSETEAFPSPAEPVKTSKSLTGKVDRVDDDYARLSDGDPDVSPQGIDAGTETPGGSNPTPDQDLVDEIGEAVGMTYEDNEPLKFGEKSVARDEARWELNPASSEDYQERHAMQTELSPSKASRPKLPAASRTGNTGRRKKPG